MELQTSQHHMIASLQQDLNPLFFAHDYSGYPLIEELSFKEKLLHETIKTH
jgi:hypothetical protein